LGMGFSVVQAHSEGLCGTSWRCCWPSAWSDATGLYQQMKGCRLHQPTKGYHLRQQTKAGHPRHHQRHLHQQTKRYHLNQAIKRYHLHQPTKDYHQQTKECRNQLLIRLTGTLLLNTSKPHLRITHLTRHSKYQTRGGCTHFKDGLGLSAFVSRLRVTSALMRCLLAAITLLMPAMPLILMNVARRLTLSSNRWEGVDWIRCTRAGSLAGSRHTVLSTKLFGSVPKACYQATEQSRWCMKLLSKLSFDCRCGPVTRSELLAPNNVVAEDQKIHFGAQKAIQCFFRATDDRLVFIE